MCTENSAIITYIIPTITGLGGAYLGARLSFGYSKKMLFETRRLYALGDFVSAFTDEIIFIESSPPVKVSPATKESPNVGYILGSKGKFCNTLMESRSKHRSAIEIFKFYISEKKYRKIYKAYEKYYNPLHMDETKDIIEKLSFGIYNMHEDEVKKNIGRKISGKNLALENIRKIINAAQE